MNKTPKKPWLVLAIFDKTEKDGYEYVIDHYTIVLRDKEPSGYYSMLGLGDDVTSPQGFSQFTSGMYFTTREDQRKDANLHLGKKIKWENLPIGHQQHIINRLKED